MGVESTYSASIDSTSDNYIGAIFGTDPKGTGALYLDQIFTVAASASLAASELFNVESTDQLSSTSATITTSGYRNAYSPTVISQTFAGTINHELFSFTSLESGTKSSKKVKVAITDIKQASEVPGSDYGSFNVVIREWGDTDKNPIVLETFSNCTMDPLSSNYVIKRIGDQYTTINDSTAKMTVNGDYPNNSKYVRITNLATTGVPKTAVPFGFKNYKKYNSGAPDLTYVTEQKVNGEWSTRGYLGIDFSHADINNYHSPLPSNKASFSSTFLLSATTGSVNGSGVVTTISGSTSTKQFIFGLQDGFDGYDPRLTAFYQTPSFGAGTSGSADFKHGLDVVKNPDMYDFNMVLIPDLYYGRGEDVLNYALDICEEREDAMLLYDAGSKDITISSAITNMNNINSSYAATYHPWVKIYDDQNKKNVWVPPSVVMGGVIAYTDRVSHEWFAPAGLNRGGITSAIQPHEFLNKSDRNELYAARINPIASFPDTGVVAYGQKNLQARPSSTDRINVRRMLIKVKKVIASASRYLLFEQSNPATWNRFKNIVNPVLDSVVANSGISEFKVIMDEKTNTSDIIAQNIMKGEIWIKPTLAAEFIVLDFNVMAQGASVEEL